MGTGFRWWSTSAWIVSLGLVGVALSAASARGDSTLGTRHSRNGCTQDSDCDSVGDANPSLCLVPTGSYGQTADDQLCIGSDSPFVVDLELGSSLVPICGAQLFLAFDSGVLQLVEIEADPDGETGLGQVLLDMVDNSAGIFDYTVVLPLGTVCDADPDPDHGTVSGGTVVRLVFDIVGRCKTPGVWFRDGSGPSRLRGPNGDLAPGGCDASNSPSPTGDLFVETSLTMACPGDSFDNSDCGLTSRHVCLDPVEVTVEACGDVAGPDCSCAFFSVCTTGLDCGTGPSHVCNLDSECASNNCVSHPLAEESGAVGFCTTGVCLDGFCTDATACSFTATDLAAGGCFDFDAGRTELDCAAGNGCGVGVDCHTEIINTGKNTLCVDVELSPNMVRGHASDPITRCIDLELRDCSTYTCSDGQPCDPNDVFSCFGDAAGCRAVSVAFQEEITIGEPNHIAGHGSFCVTVPVKDWKCVTAFAAGKSLAAGCSVECVDNRGAWTASFTDSPESNGQCHWLVQGDLDGNGFIDISDFTILAGQYLSMVDSVGACADIRQADFNGDGFVSLADYTFLTANFFYEETDECSADCSWNRMAEESSPRSTLTVRQLIALGLGSYARAADVDGSGAVDLVDMMLFVERYAAEDREAAGILRIALEKLDSGLAISRPR